MKLSKKEIDELLVLIEHTRLDMSYREGGTFVSDEDENEVDNNAWQQVDRAIKTIKKIILEN